MIKERKTFEIECDRCHVVEIITTVDHNHGHLIPEGWKEKMNPDWHSWGAIRTTDLFCPECLAKDNK